MLILGIETTCDETGIAILDCVNDKIQILANEVATQYKVHSKYGGVVPILAAREQAKNLPPLYEKVLREAKTKATKIDYIAFAIGPGLPPALVAGKKFVVELAKKLGKKIIPVNHLFGHLVTPLIKNTKRPQKLALIEFPALGLIISGGHTVLLYMKSLSDYQKLGATLDDAIGESLDKAARILGLEYPGGPKLEILAKKGRPLFTLPRPLLHQRGFNFSFSGLKTAFRELVDQVHATGKFDENTKANLAASFQKTIFDVLIFKLNRAIEVYRPKTLIVGGGVIANQYLKDLLRKTGWLKIFFPDKALATDNGVQIAAAGHYLLRQNINPQNYDLLDINPNLKLEPPVVAYD